jgi:hypothetical protein
VIFGKQMSHQNKKEKEIVNHIHLIQPYSVLSLYNLSLKRPPYLNILLIKRGRKREKEREREKKNRKKERKKIKKKNTTGIFQVRYVILLFFHEQLNIVVINHFQSSFPQLSSKNTKR